MVWCGNTWLWSCGNTWLWCNVGTRDNGVMWEHVTMVCYGNMWRWYDVGTHDYGVMWEHVTMVWCGNIWLWYDVGTCDYDVMWEHMTMVWSGVMWNQAQTAYLWIEGDYNEVGWTKLSFGQIGSWMVDNSLTLQVCHYGTLWLQEVWITRWFYCSTRYVHIILT